MRTLLLSVFCAFHLAAQTSVPAATEPKLMVRFYKLVAELSWRDRPEQPEPWPFSIDGLEEPTQAQTIDAREFLQEKGVAFPPGAGAVFLRGSDLLRVTNTAENQALVARIARNEGADLHIRQIAIETRLVEYRPEVEGRLMMRGTFADLQKALGEGVRTVAVSSLVTRSGNRSVADSGRELPDDAKNEKGARPPAERAEFDVEPTLGADGSTTDFKYTLNYTAPDNAGGAAPKVQLQGTHAVRNGAIVVANTFTVPDAAKPGEPRNFAVLLRCATAMKFDSQLFGVEARVVEYRAAAKDRLAMRGTFADLQKALGESVRTVATTRLVTKNGMQSMANSGPSVLDEETGRNGARRQSEGAVLDVEPQLGRDGWSTEISYALNYAAPVTGGRAEPRVQLSGAHAIANGEIVIANTFSLADPAKGEPRRFAVLVRSEILDEARRPFPPEQQKPRQQIPPH